MMLRMLLLLSVPVVLVAMAFWNGHYHLTSSGNTAASSTVMDMAVLVVWPFLQRQHHAATTKHTDHGPPKHSDPMQHTSPSKSCTSCETTPPKLPSEANSAVSSITPERSAWTIPSDFDVTRSTRDNYQVSTHHDLHQHLANSRYASVRASLDYQYHALYSLERQAFQDDLIHHVLLSQQQQQQHAHKRRHPLSSSSEAPPLLCTNNNNNNSKSATTNTATSTAGTILQDPPQSTTTPESSASEPMLSPPQWIIFTAGAMGAGKTYTLQWLQQQGYLFPSSMMETTENNNNSTTNNNTTNANHHHSSSVIISVDPDVLRRHLPEFETYLQHSPQHAGEYTRHEAGLLTELLTSQALTLGHSVVVDGSLRDAAWYQEYLATLRGRFPQIHMAILHITADRSIVVKRAYARAQTTGRHIPTALLEQALVQVPASVQQLTPHVDMVVTLANEASGIRIVEPAEMTWPEFAAIWKTPLVVGNGGDGDTTTAR